MTFDSTDNNTNSGTDQAIAGGNSEQIQRQAHSPNQGQGRRWDKAQMRHEEAAAKRLLDRVSADHEKVGRLGSSALGRELMNKPMPIGNDDEENKDKEPALSRVQRMAKLIEDLVEEKNKKRGMPRSGLVELKMLVRKLQEAQAAPLPFLTENYITPKRREEKTRKVTVGQRMFPEKLTAYEYLATIIVRTILDHISVKEASSFDDNTLQWQTTGSAVRHLGDSAGMLWVNAHCYLLDIDYYGVVARQWSRKHQGADNRRVNIMIAQRDMYASLDAMLAGLPEEPGTVPQEMLEHLSLEERRALRRQTWFAVDQKPELQKMRDAATEKLNEVRWSRQTENEVGRLLLSTAKELDLFEIVRGKAKGRNRREPNQLAPSGSVLKVWKEEVLPRLTKDQLVQVPMISKPLPWWHLNCLGAQNTSGGYHNPGLRLHYPLVRGKGEDNRTKPSETAVKFANTLGATSYTTDSGMVDCYRWVAENRRDYGIAVRPLKTKAELDAEKSRLMAEDNRGPNGGIIVDGVELIQGTEEHNLWKAQRKAAYDQAIDETSKYIRTITVIHGLEALKDQPRLCYSWSYDSRMRIYPQQSQCLHPQGSSVERTLLRFEAGEEIKVGSDADTRIKEAIGVAWKDGKCSREVRATNGALALQEILPLISQGDPSDLVVMERLNADQPFELLQLLRHYQAAVIDRTSLWHVGIGADASQSGLQILSGLCRDRKGLENTNVILPEGYQGTDGAVDGYLKVVREAEVLLKDPAFTQKVDKNGNTLSAGALAVMTQILAMNKIRSLAKGPVMILPYGGSFIGCRAKIEKSLEKDLGVDLLGMVRGDSKAEKWQAAQEVLTGLTRLIRAAAARVYPSAVALMDWFKGVTKLALKKQADQNEPLHMKWSLSDGSQIYYAPPKWTSQSLKDPILGHLTMPVEPSLHERRENDILKWVAPSFTHSLDGLLLRTAFDGWTGPLTAIHDCIQVLPSQMDDALERIRKAYIEIMTNEANSLQSFVKGLGLEDDVTSYPIVGKPEDDEALFEEVKKSVFMFN